MTDSTAAAAAKPRGRKAAPSPAEPTQAPPSTAALAETAVQLVPYRLLARAPENVRHTAEAEDALELADDITAHGLLQSLIGYQSEDLGQTWTWIVGGGRRYAALSLLHTRGLVTDDYRVPVLVRDRSEAIELSLSENLARRDMNPVDEFAAFAALMAPGNVSPADLAKRFGFTERYVKQRLRFADLHPDILQALRDGKLTIETATEYAKTSDQALQLAVFRAIARGSTYNRDSLYHLKSMLSAEQMREDDIVFQFIDRETYEREGGGYVEDLFGDELQARRLSDTALAKTIATRCLEFQADTRILPRAKSKHPSVVGVVTDPIGFGQAKSPKGFVDVVGGWNGHLNQHVDIDECWARADREAVPIRVIAHITHEEPLDEDDDGSPLEVIATYRRDRFFVPKDDVKRVLPPKRATSYGGGPILTEEQRQAEILEGEARVWAARLSIPRLHDVPGLEGRAFYADNWIDSHKAKPGDPVTTKTPSLTVRIFVTEDEIAANLDAGRARAIELRNERDAARVAKDAAAAAAAEAQAKALTDMLTTIGALAEKPAVIMAAEYADDEPRAWFLWSSGDYWDAREGSDDADDAMGIDLPDMVDEMAKVTGYHLTLADYEAEQQPALAEAAE